MRKSVYLAVPFVLLVLFLAFLRALDPRPDVHPPVVAPASGPPKPASVDLLPLVDTASTGDLYFGQNGDGGEWYKGEIRDVAVWGRGFRESEIVPWKTAENPDGSWPLDAQSPELVRDGSTNRNSGKLFGGASWTSEGSGEALSLDGKTGFVRIPRSDRLETPAVSVSCWIRRAAVQGTWANVVRKTWLNNTGPTFMSWSLQLNPTGKDPGILAFNTGFRYEYHTLLAKTAIPEGRWTHVVAVYDPGSAARQKRLYVDDTLVASSEDTRALLFDSVRNQWHFDGKILVSPEEPGTPGRLPIPAELPEEYDLTVDAQRSRGVEALHLGLRCGSSGCTLVLDGLESGEYRSGIDLVDGKSFRENSTTVSRRLIVNNAPFTLKVLVRKTEIRVLLDGSALLEWKGNPSTLSTSPFFRFPRPGALYLGTWESSYRISRLMLEPVASGIKDP